MCSKLIMACAVSLEDGTSELAAGADEAFAKVGALRILRRKESPISAACLLHSG